MLDSGRGNRMTKLMIAAGFNEKELARKSGLPLQTVLKALKGAEMSEVIYYGLEQTCAEEIEANKRR